MTGVQTGSIMVQAEPLDVSGTSPTVNIVSAGPTQPRFLKNATNSTWILINFAQIESLNRCLHNILTFSIYTISVTQLLDTTSNRGDVCLVVHLKQ